MRAYSLLIYDYLDMQEKANGRIIQKACRLVELKFMKKNKIK